MKIDDKLALDLFHVDKEPHIKINQDLCRKCPHKACTRVCPVENYTLVEGEIVFAWEGCLECGICRIVCDQGGMEWNYPPGGFGVIYRMG